MGTAWIVLCVALASPHDTSHSSSRIAVEGRRATLEIQCQSQSLAEALAVDLDGDRRLDARELDAGRSAIAGYLASRYRVRTGGSDAAQLVFTLDALETVGARLDEQVVRARFSADAGAAIERLAIEVSLFREQNPFHRDTATIEWNSAESAAHVFGEGVDAWEFLPNEARRPGVVLSHLRLGMEHILTGYDHLAFLLALLVASRRLRSLAGIVTAFTAAHSVTLASAALGLFDLPSRLVELAIALSVAYVGAENLLVRETRARWLEAFGFGLVHGLGFAGFLGDSLLYEPLKISALVGFNLGVEIGQLGVVLAVAGLIRLAGALLKRARTERDALAPNWLRLAASALVLSLGLFWFGERAGWLT